VSRETTDEPRPFFADVTSANGRAFVTVGGECDVATLERLNGVLSAVLDREPSEIVVDLANATFVDSSTLAALVVAAKRMHKRGGAFRVVGARAPEVRRVLEITGLDEYLSVPARP
jgi:anti-sigma B factor antagonist